MKPVFLTLDEALAIQADQLRRYGGAGGLRDLGLLKSALAMPQSAFGGEWLHPTLPEVASAYLFHLVKNHPFVDGNKRVGLAAALAFLGINDLRLVATEDEVVDLVSGTASSAIGKADVAVFIRSHVARWQP